MEDNSVAFQSFPSSGNNLLRRYVENITGVYTGCDLSSDNILREALSGFLGHGHVNDDK